MRDDKLSLEGALCSCCRAWQLEVRTDDRLEASADLVFPADYPGFAGHFPGGPILPAIVQLAAVRHLAERAAGCRLLPQRYDKIKFPAMVGPDERVSATVALSAHGAGWSGTFSLTRQDGQRAAAGRVEFIVQGKNCEGQ